MTNQRYVVYSWGGDDEHGWERHCPSLKSALAVALARALRMSTQRVLHSGAPYVIASGPNLAVRFDVGPKRIWLHNRQVIAIRDVADLLAGVGHNAHPDTHGGKRTTAKRVTALRARFKA